MRGGVTLQPAVDLAEGSHLCRVKVSCTSEDTVKYRTDVAVGQEKEVLAGPIHIKTRLPPHDFKIKGHQVVCAAQ